MAKERFKISVALMLAIALMCSLFPMTALASMEDSGNDATVKSFGEYTNTFMVAYGTSHGDAAAELPEKLPAVVTERAEPYNDETSVTYDTEIEVQWECESYFPETSGKYVFTASFSEDRWNYDGEMPTATVTVLVEGQTLASSEPEEQITVTPSPAAEEQPTESSATEEEPAEQEPQETEEPAENESPADSVIPPTEDVAANSEAAISAAGDIGIMTEYAGNCGAAPNTSSVIWTFNTESGVLEISGNGPMADFGAEPPWHEYRDASGNVHQFCSFVKEVVVGDNVTHIGDFAFKSQSNLAKVTIPDSVTSIGKYVFLNCTQLTAIDIPDTVTSIGEGAFRNNDNLVSVKIPQGLRVIKSYTFDSCDKLPSVTIPSWIESIENDAFGGCTSLTSIVFQINDPPGSRAFNGQPQNGQFFYPGGSGADDQKWIDWAMASGNIQFWTKNRVGSTDETPPKLSGGESIRESGSEAGISFVSDEAGEYYYVKVPAGSTPVPAISTENAGTPCDAGRIPFDISGLNPEDAIDVYVVVKDAAGKVSEPLKINVDDYLTRVTVDQPTKGGVINEDGAEAQSGNRIIGSEPEFEAIPSPGYRFTGWTVTGEGSSMDDLTSATAKLTVGTGETTIKASFAANMVTLNIRLDDKPYIKYGDKFWLSQNGTSFISADPHVASSAIETFSAVPDGTYKVYAGDSAASSTAMNTTLIVDGNNSSQVINYYTLTVRALPSGTVTPQSGAFLAGTKISVTATADTTSGIFKRWVTSDASGEFEDRSANTTKYTVAGRATLTAYFLQTDGLVITPPAQDTRKTTADKPEITVSTEVALGAGDGDSVQISALRWFRESVNSPVASEGTFDTYYGAADPADMGEINTGGFGSVQTANANIKAEINGRYWFAVTLVSGSTSVTKVGFTDIKNIFTPYEVKVKHTVTVEQADEIATDLSLDYAAVTNTIGGDPGIPYDLNGTDVIEELPDDLDYDRVIVTGLPMYSGTADTTPPYGGAYDFYVAGDTNKDTPHTLILDTDFLTAQNMYCDKDPQDALKDNYHLYTVRYEQDTSLWVTLRAFRVNTEGDSIQTSSGAPGGVNFKNYQDFAAPLDADGLKTISKFKEEGGVFTPRDVHIEEEEGGVPTGEYLTYAPVGWYIASGPVDFSDDFDPFADQTVNDVTHGTVTYHAQTSWKDFDPVPLTIAGDPAPATGSDPAYWPLADGKKLYLICYGDTHVARVWEEYHLFKRDDTMGSGKTGDPLGKAATFELLDPSGHDYKRTTAKGDIPGYVAVGYRIVTASEWDDIKNNEAPADRLLSAKPLIDRDPPDDPRQGMWDSVKVTIDGNDLIDGTGAYGNYAHVVYYYAPDSNENGLPDCGEYPITVNYVGVRADGTMEAVKPSQILRPRLDPMNTDDANATMIYVGLDGQIYWKSAELNITDITNAAQRDGVNFGDEYKKIQADGQAAWIFRPSDGNNQLIPVKIPDVTGSVLTLNFYYDYAADGNNIDKNQFVTERYEGAAGAQISSYVPVQNPALDTREYNGKASALPGYAAVGWVPRDFEGITEAADKTQAEELKAVPGFKSFYQNSALTVSLQAGAGRIVTYIYLPNGEDADDDGLVNGDEAAKGADPLDPDTDDDGMPDGWEADNGLDPGDRTDAEEDADDDGLNNKGEYDNVTDPHDSDTDDDGLPDGWEVEHKLDSTDDGLDDTQTPIPGNPNGAAGDPDKDGWTNIDEYDGGTDSTDPQTAETRELSFDANGGRYAPDSVTLPADGSYTVKLPDAGAMRRDGYVFVNWCTDQGGNGILYKEGDLFTLNRISGRAYGDSNVTLYAIWDIAPYVELRAPRIDAEGNVTLDGSVIRTLYNYDVVLEYREANGSDEWILLYKAGNVSDNFDIEKLPSANKLLPADTLKRDTLYEVRLTASNTNIGGQKASATQSFRIPAAQDPGETTGDIKGEVENNVDEDAEIDVFLSLQTSGVTIQSVMLEDIAYGDNVAREYIFTDVPDGWYSVVAYNVVDDEYGYTITTNVHMVNGHMESPPERIVFTKGKTESRVTYEPEVPAVTEKYLASLFDPDLTPRVYTEDDEELVNSGGKVELRLEVTVVSERSEEALDLAAAEDGQKPVLYVDLSVFKICYDSANRVINSMSTPLDELPRQLEISVPKSAYDITGVYRIHGTSPAPLSINGTNGEYFDKVKSILHVDKFSDYALTADAHTVTAVADPVAGGTVAPALKSYFENESVSVIASAKPGYAFRSWTVTEGGIDLAYPNANPAKFTMPAQNVTLQANFIESATANQFSIAASAGEGGKIEPEGEVVVPSGGAQRFAFTPYAGYHVADVLVDGQSIGAGNTYAFEDVRANRAIEVRFERDLPSPDSSNTTYTITATAGEHGSISPSGTVTVNEGGSFTFAINAEYGYHVADVLVDGQGVGADNTYTFEDVRANRAIEARFEQDSPPPGQGNNTYKITAAAGEYGSVSPSGIVTVNEGGKLTIAINPQNGYRVAEVTVDGVNVENVQSYTFEDVHANHTLEARFAPGTNVPQTGDNSDMIVWLLMLLASVLALLCAFLWLKLQHVKGTWL